MTKRSSHMPTLTNIAMMNSSAGVRPHALRIQSNCGVTMLQRISDPVEWPVRAGHAVLDHEPLVLVAAVPAEERLHARSRRPTIRPVASMTLPMFSRCRIVMKSSRS